MTMDHITKKFICPVKIIKTTGNIENPEVLLDAQSGQPTIKPRPFCSLRGKTSLLIDFGQEIFGGLRFVTAATDSQNRPVQISVKLGESVSEAMSEPNNDHGINYDNILLPWCGMTEYGKTGFRFACISSMNDDFNLELRELNAYCYYYDIKHQGSFECNDDVINQIWQMGAKTVHLNMQDYIWDGVKRDRLVWIGDMHPEVSVISRVFGHVELVEKSLDFVRDETPLPEFMNNINSYSMWWVLIQHHWYMHHGNLGYLMQQKDYLISLLGLLELYVDDNGKECLPEKRFIDWLSHDDELAIDVGLQALLCMTFNAGSELLEYLHEYDLKTHFKALAEKMRGNEAVHVTNKPVTALQAMANIASPEFLNQTILSVDPFKGLSPFYGYYVLTARAMAGDVLGGLDLLRYYWAGMIKLGATTFWEHFDIAWLKNAGRIDEIPSTDKVDVHKTYGEHCYKSYRHSLCHGWAGGPTAWLSEYVLGIIPTSPGYKTIAVDPNLGDLAWAKGAIPTPNGLIRVKHKKRADGTIETDISLPDNITISVNPELCDK